MAPLPRVRTSPFTLIYITIKVGGGEGGGQTALQTEYLIKCVAINMKTPGFQCCMFSGGALDGGVPMSHVEFKKCQYPLSLKWQCPMSPLRCPHVAC